MSGEANAITGAYTGLDTYFEESTTTQAQTHVLNAIRSLATQHDFDHQDEDQTRWNEWNEHVGTPLLPAYGLHGKIGSKLDIGIRLRHDGVDHKLGAWLGLYMDEESQLALGDASDMRSITSNMDPHDLKAREIQQAETLEIAEILDVEIQRKTIFVPRKGLKRASTREAEFVAPGKIARAAKKHYATMVAASRLIAITFDLKAHNHEHGDPTLVEGVVFDPTTRRAVPNVQVESRIQRLNPYGILGRELNRDIRLSGTDNVNVTLDNLTGMKPEEILNQARTGDGAALLKEEIEKRTVDLCITIAGRRFLHDQILESITASEDFKRLAEDPESIVSEYSGTILRYNQEIVR